MASDGRFFDLLTVQVAAGSTVRSAAAEIGCSERQAYRLSGQPEFRQRVAELRTEATTAAVGRLSDAASEAVDTLRGLLDEKHEASTRLQAAKAILAAVGPMSESLELRERIDQLEAERTHAGPAAA